MVMAVHCWGIMIARVAWIELHGIQHMTHLDAASKILKKPVATVYFIVLPQTSYLNSGMLIAITIII